jgi:hypothetical protein
MLWRAGRRLDQRAEMAGLPHSALLVAKRNR